MIELYSGTPGSGKSLHVAKIIRERLRMYNCVIIGNFYVNQNTVKKRKGTYIYVDNSRLEPERLIKFAIRYARHKGRRLKEDELYLFIDEAQLLFNSRDWQLIKTSGWVSFYSQHRKLGFYIGLIAQFDRMLDRQIRSLVENEIKVFSKPEKHCITAPKLPAAASRRGRGPRHGETLLRRAVQKKRPRSTFPAERGLLVKGRKL